MLSRTADSLFWLARYVERADNTARIIDAASRLAAMPISYAGSSNEWESALAAARDLAAAFDPGNIGKLHLLADCTSDVPGFEHLGRDFLAELAGQGMRLVDSAGFQAP